MRTEFCYVSEIKDLAQGKRHNLIKESAIPEWLNNSNFTDRFLPYLHIIGDSREQDQWIGKACKYYGIGFTWAKKDEKAGTENLKEGDYTFKVIFPNKTYDYTGVVAFERKGSLNEFFGNCTKDRARIEREFDRFKSKGYKKVVLMLQFGECLLDLIDAEYSYKKKGTRGKIIEKNTSNTLYNAVMSWKQPNNKNFEIIQSGDKETLFWEMVQEMYWFFRNELKNEFEVKYEKVQG